MKRIAPLSTLPSTILHRERIAPLSALPMHCAMASKQRLPDLLREREEEGRRQVVELRARTVRPQYPIPHCV